MIRLSRWRRASAAVLALWFGGIPAESLAVRSCPMHDLAGRAGAGTAVTTGAAHDAHDARAAHATHRAHAGHAAPAEGGERSAPTPCNCLGQCLGAGVVAIAAPRIGVVPAPQVRRAPLRLVTVPAPRREAPHRLPFAIPPPVARLAA